MPEDKLLQIFTERDTINKIQTKLPEMFAIAELESSRAGKIGMEVGSLRERILVSLLIYKFGEENVDTDIPITEPEVDVKLFGKPISIKTITGLGGIKLIWTVDAKKAQEFRKKYVPKCDILLALIKWNKKGGLYYIPVEVQQEVFKQMGKNHYIKLPKRGTNPRGVEITKDALVKIINHPNTKSIEIFWQRSEIDYNPYARWVDYWKE